MINNIKNKLAAVLFAIFLSLTITEATAQTASETSNAAVISEAANKPKAKLGTYQIFGLDGKFKQAFTDETFVLIEEKRKEHEDVTLTLNFGVAVFIPSKDAISAPGFKPLAQFYQEQ